MLGTHSRLACCKKSITGRTHSHIRGTVIRDNDREKLPSHGQSTLRYKQSASKQTYSSTISLSFRHHTVRQTSYRLTQYLHLRLITKADTQSITCPHCISLPLLHLPADSVSYAPSHHYQDIRHKSKFYQSYLHPESAQ